MIPGDIDSIVKRAQQLGPRDRAEFVRTACGQDPLLLSNVLNALGEQAQDPAFWDEPADTSFEPAQPAQGMEGQRLGPYRIERKLGTGGMGDVLTGTIAALRAQGLDAFDAACAGTLLHSAAADAAARDGGERGLLASDLFPHLRRLANP